jgi:UDP-galactopyranose mutase
MRSLSARAVDECSNPMNKKRRFMHGSYYIAVHDCFKHRAGQDIFLLDWRQVLSYNISFLNMHLFVNSVINLVSNNNLLILIH